MLEAVEEFELAPAPGFDEESPATADPFFAFFLLRKSPGLPLLAWLSFQFNVPLLLCEAFAAVDSNSSYSSLLTSSASSSFSDWL